MTTFDVTVSTAHINARLRKLYAETGPANSVLAETLNKISFEILNAERGHLSRVFKFAGPSTREYISGRGSVLFDKATVHRLNSIVFVRGAKAGTSSQKRSTADIVADHVRSVQLQKREHLTFRGKLAVPVRGGPAKRNVRGRVWDGFLPSQIMAPGNGGFVSRSGRAIVQRTVLGGQETFKVVYALVARATAPAVVNFQSVAAATAKRTVNSKLARSIQKFNKAWDRSR